MCPVCLEKTELPDSKVKNLPVDPEIEELMKQNMEILHPKREKCPVHKEERLNAYCKTCDQVTCWQCAYSNHENQNAVLKMLINAIQTQKQ